MISDLKCDTIICEYETKGFNMNKFKEPVFLPEELAEARSSRLSIGYNMGELMGGYDFKNKPFANKVSKSSASAKEKLDGTAKKRQYHEKINAFGWARMDNSKQYNKTLVFGIKFSAPSGLTKIGKNTIAKYNQLLGYYLQQVGWQGMFIDDFDNFVVPLNNPTNIKLLHTLSPSIGFYYKSARPDMETLEELEYLTKYEQNKPSKQKQR